MKGKNWHIQRYRSLSRLRTGSGWQRAESRLPSRILHGEINSAFNLFDLPPTNSPARTRNGQQPTMFLEKPQNVFLKPLSETDRFVRNGFCIEETETTVRNRGFRLVFVSTWFFWKTHSPVTFLVT